ncbi:FAD:protein FMN transferase [Gallibacterium genomosp. 3]|uniref:FAD:protein FMN transferase n=1 Tax=Gallibacterium genomosp. 3 TaxID=505345 RepID=UPI0008026946|nr:FAD:protein FMN transferase [Gallibacterium genomosp. 3]
MFSLSGETMASIWNVKIAETVSKSKQEMLENKIKRVLYQVNQQMSPFLPNSEISQFNASTSTDPIRISPEMRLVVDKALTICQETQGIYDITISPLVNIWGFGALDVEKHPSSEQVARALKKVNYQALCLSDDGLSKQQADIHIDLCSIAKGFAVDRIAEILENQGLQNYLIEIGGELRLSGSRYGQTWVVGLERPQWGGGVYEQILTFKDVSKGIATSGNYRNYFKDDGKVAAHEINTKTGYSSTSSILSVTVIADNCMIADGYATALFLLGESAFEFAEKHKIAALFMVSSPSSSQLYQLQCSRHFLQTIQLEQPNSQ